jgi:hypothetical protein
MTAVGKQVTFMVEQEVFVPKKTSYKVILIGNNYFSRGKKLIPSSCRNLCIPHLN